MSLPANICSGYPLSRASARAVSKSSAIPCSDSFTLPEVKSMSFEDGTPSLLPPLATVGNYGCRGLFLQVAPGYLLG
jgi:hypothetical protein